MIRSKIQVFIAKRLLLLFAVLALLDILFINDKWYVLAGLTAGSLLGLLRLSMMESSLTRILDINKKSARKKHDAFVFVINYLFAAALLIITVKISLPLFIGAFLGILSAPFIIFINSVTEGLGITHNKFE